LGIITRGNDKRMYLVKQTVDTNISAVLNNVINQIKKGNMGARELISSKNIFNILGKFQDIVIPTNANGDAPIQFEIMQGQDIPVKTELFEMLEQMAINPTSVPYEYIQSRKNVDYAIRLTMANMKFLKKAYLRQQILMEQLAKPVFSKLYNGEYVSDSDTDEEIEVRLPTPSFLNTINTNTNVENIKNMVDSVVDSETVNIEPDAEQLGPLMKRDLYRSYLQSFIDYKLVDRIKQEAKEKLQSEYHVATEEE
jgi:hypothetical protein